MITEKKIDATVKSVEKMLVVGTPLIAVDSYDHPHTQSRLLEMLNKRERAVVAWNIATAFEPLNDEGQKAMSALEDSDKKAASAGPHAALHVAQKFPDGTVVLFDNLHWFWDKPPVMQAMLNLREPFKGSKRAVIALTLNAKIPGDLVQSTSFVEDPLPSEELLAEKVERIHSSALKTEVEHSAALGYARELRGTSPFRAEQLIAQSLTKAGICNDQLRDNARKQINDTPGLTGESSRETLADIGGLDAVRDFLKRYFDGPRRPSVVVRIEEIEKALAGVSTESSGTSGDALGTILTAMEDNHWTGILAYGVSGCGKSLVAKAAANEFGAKAIRFDLNACKNPLVGESEKQIRQAMDILKAIGGDRVFFIASMNQIAALPPELRRRFAAGTWYFDVPTKESRKQIWKICAQQFNVKYDGYDAEDLTGADIRDIVQRSYELGCTTKEAAKYHVPLCKSAPDAISKSREDAYNRYLDANEGGPYRSPSTKAKKATSERSFE